MDRAKAERDCGRAWHNRPHDRAEVDFVLLTQDLRRLFSNGLEIEPISVTVEGDRAVFEQRQIAVLANGRSYDNCYVFIFEMVGPQVRRIREYMDTFGGHEMVFGDAAPAQIV